MRLTLRTLIAWLDDTLTPGEVRAIGQQVADSPFAKELVERIHRVTRQRRLSVPNGSGPDAVDPNHVASYLDNQLPADQVGEFEKTCLTSDVHLAEVASVHQVLSLIGHKAKVPPDAKLRMYRLVRGREASSEKPPAPPAPARAARDRGAKAMASASARPWSGELDAPRPFIERHGGSLLVLGLIGVLVLAASHSLRPERSPTAIARSGGEAARPAPADASKGPATPREEAPRTTVPATVPPPVEPTPEPIRVAEATRDDLGVFETTQGVVLRAVAGAIGWERVAAKAPFKEPARLVNLAPFRNTLKVGKTDIDLVESTEILLEGVEKDQASRIDLARGQVVVRATRPNTPFAVRFGGHVLSVLAAPGVNVGIERAPTLLPNSTEPAPARLRIFVPEGEISLRSGESEETLTGPGQVSFGSSGRFAEKGRQASPSWVAESSSAPTAYSQEIGDQFAGYFREGRPILSDVVEAMEDPQPNVKRLAVLALGAIGDTDSVVAGLDRKGDPAVHRAVVEVLRAGLARGGDPAKAVRESLARQFDDTWGPITERLLAGFPPEGSKDEPTLAKLVEYLSTAPSRGTRELALDNLRALTGRDTLEYDPDAPEGKGLKAWQDLVRKKEITKDARPAPGAR